nr:homoserine kinase [Tanacetum cinerariifolium]
MLLLFPIDAYAMARQIIYLLESDPSRNEVVLTRQALMRYSHISTAEERYNSWQEAYALMAVGLQGDCVGLGKAMSSDKIVELRRMPSIPGMEDVKKVMIKAGRLGVRLVELARLLCQLPMMRRNGGRLGRKWRRPLWLEEI